MQDTYHGALLASIEAAREAGALLRQDLLKPGGTSGHDGHAEADEPAKRLIRQRLLAATPDWGYLGAETGRAAGTDGRHTWLVDPNDGTRSYLKGYRGSAVSMALLRDGVPVLGVVYTFAAPDNRGDLFAWAEACGPLQRNGIPLERSPWARAITPHTVVLVSQAADRAVDANLACVAPGRYRAVPSSAYRLALVTAGEGEVGVSLMTMRRSRRRSGSSPMTPTMATSGSCIGSSTAWAWDGRLMRRPRRVRCTCRNRRGSPSRRRRSGRIAN